MKIIRYKKLRELVQNITKLRLGCQEIRYACHQLHYHGHTDVNLHHDLSKYIYFVLSVFCLLSPAPNFPAYCSKCSCVPSVQNSAWHTGSLDTYFQINELRLNLQANREMDDLQFVRTWCYLVVLATQNHRIVLGENNHEQFPNYGLCRCRGFL